VEVNGFVPNIFRADKISEADAITLQRALEKLGVKTEIETADAAYRRILSESICNNAPPQSGT
jgi:hypothetical protein